MVISSPAWAWVIPISSIMILSTGGIAILVKVIENVYKQRANRMGQGDVFLNTVLRILTNNEIFYKLVIAE
jgi:hypothetical protein